MAQYATPSIHSGSGQRDLDDTNGVTVADTMEESSRGIHLELAVCNINSNSTYLVDTLSIYDIKR